MARTAIDYDDDDLEDDEESDIENDNAVMTRKELDEWRRALMDELKTETAKQATALRSELESLRLIPQNSTAELEAKLTALEAKITELQLIPQPSPANNPENNPSSGGGGGNPEPNTPANPNPKHSPRIRTL